MAQSRGRPGSLIRQGDWAGPDRGDAEPLPALPRGRVHAPHPDQPGPPQVAGPWYPMAMVASNAALLDTESAPVRLSIKELRPTAQEGLEITVRRWWVGPAGVGGGGGSGGGRRDS